MSLEPVPGSAPKLPSYRPENEVQTAPGTRFTHDWTTPTPGVTIPTFMSALFFKRFLQSPFQIASIMPSSKALVKKVARKMDFSHPRIIA